MNNKCWSLLLDGLASGVHCSGTPRPGRPSGRAGHRHRPHSLFPAVPAMRVLIFFAVLDLLGRPTGRTGACCHQRTPPGQQYGQRADCVREGLGVGDPSGQAAGPTGTYFASAMSGTPDESGPLKSPHHFPCLNEVSCEESNKRPCLLFCN